MDALSPNYNIGELGASVILARLDELENRIQELITEKDTEEVDIKRDEVVITKNQTNKATNVIERWFGQLSGDVIAQLDFIDKSTFGFLDSIPKKCGVRIITSNIKDREICKRRAKQCAEDRPHFAITEITKVHQRWIGSSDSFFIEIGADLKTDALGRSTHTIRRVEPSKYSESVKHFETFWRTKQKDLRELYGEALEKSTFVS